MTGKIEPTTIGCGAAAKVVEGCLKHAPAARVTVDGVPRSREIRRFPKSFFRFDCVFFCPSHCGRLLYRNGGHLVDLNVNSPGGYAVLGTRARGVLIAVLQYPLMPFGAEDLSNRKGLNRPGTHNLLAKAVGQLRSVFQDKDVRSSILRCYFGTEPEISSTGRAYKLREKVRTCLIQCSMRRPPPSSVCSGFGGTGEVKGVRWNAPSMK
ncbi:MAG: hypothetical protein HYY93_09345 [Planctomycetes bacterium]|nr:hypothetical protein [Planctomycetota bacterium]